MNKGEKAKLEEIYRDCINLEGIKDLTEYGAGQGDLCIILLGKRRKPFRYVK